MIKKNEDHEKKFLPVAGDCVNDPACQTNTKSVPIDTGAVKAEVSKTVDDIDAPLKAKDAENCYHFLQMMNSIAEPTL